MPAKIPFDRLRASSSIVLVAVLLLGGLTPLSASASTQPPGAWSVEHVVDAEVVDNYATVNVTAIVENQAAGPAYPFAVELPDEAYVTGLAITRNNTTYEADIAPREEARDRYEQARTEGRSASLVEKDRRTSTYHHALHVEANETVEATLTYEVYLTPHAGTYTLPLHAPATPQGRDEGASFEVELRHGRGLTNVDADPQASLASNEDVHRVEREIGPRGLDNASRLEVRYETGSTDPGGRLLATVDNGTGYFAHRFQADTEAARIPVDLALVLDRSGSMGGAKMAQLKTATHQVAQHLDERDRVHVTSFADNARTAWEGFQAMDEATKGELADQIEALAAGGSTNIEDATRTSFAAFEEDASQQRLPVVAFLTDGQATTGLQANTQLRALASEANAVDANVFGLAFGSGADWGLVHGLAEDGDGYAERVPAGEGAEVDLERFLTRLTSPVVTNLSVSYEHGSVESWQLGSPVLFAGSELVHVGTFDPDLRTLNATVEAHGAEDDIRADVSAAIEKHHDHPGARALPSIVAYQRIQELEQRIDAHGENESWVENATRLALEHGFVTERTSLVVDLPHRRPDAGDVDADRDNGTAHATGDADAVGYDDSASRVDDDGDGIPSASDACPNEAGVGANNGCPQTDASTPLADRSNRARDDGEQTADGEPEQTPWPSVLAALLALASLARITRD